MKTITRIALFVLITINFSSGFSQDKKQTWLEVKQNYIIEKLNLSEQQIAEFTPIYQQMHQDLRTLRRNFRKSKQAKRIIEMTDEEVETLLNESFDYKQKELNLKKQYHLKFKAILPIKKIAQLYHLEKTMARQRRNNRQ